MRDSEKRLSDARSLLNGASLPLIRAHAINAALCAIAARADEVIE
jgi:hypothetical protein